jgi:hypothetical protein
VYIRTTGINSSQKDKISLKKSQVESQIILFKDF